MKALIFFLSLGKVLTKAYLEDKPQIQKHSISFSDQPWSTLSYSGEESTEPCTSAFSRGFCGDNNCFNIQVNYPESCSNIILSDSASSQTFVDELQNISEMIPTKCYVAYDRYSKLYNIIAFQALYTVSASTGSGSPPTHSCYAFKITVQKDFADDPQLQCIINFYFPQINGYSDDLKRCQNKKVLDILLLCFGPSLFLIGCCFLTYKSYPRIKILCARLSHNIRSVGLWKRHNKDVEHLNVSNFTQREHSPRQTDQLLIERIPSPITQNL